jgi:uncharacterized protein (TIGR02757 family)
LKGELDVLVLRFGPGHLHSDPIRFPRLFEVPEDREAVALIAALFAYGNVKAMGTFLQGLLECLGPNPHRALVAGRPLRAVPLYRFQTSKDVRRFLGALGAVLHDHGSLEAAFGLEEGDAEAKLENLALLLREKAGRLTPGLAHLLPLPSDGSACKRWWMFLRWVVRPDDGVDLGLWRCLKPDQLRIPVDTHLARIAFALGLTRRTTPDRAFALEVTHSLAAFCPKDPTRYDFALARLGILRECPRRQVESVCRACSLRPHCALGAKHQR